jgi:hypothetical protein
MKNLTNFQKRTLTFYLQHQTSEMTILRLFAFNWRIYLWFFILGALALALASVLPSFTYVVIGMLFGTLLRDIRGFYGTAKIWPLVREITDWNKAQEIARRFDIEK